MYVSTSLCSGSTPCFLFSVWRPCCFMSRGRNDTAAAQNPRGQKKQYLCIQAAEVVLCYCSEDAESLVTSVRAIT